jgi:hypothetical protein
LEKYKILKIVLIPIYIINEIFLKIKKQIFQEINEHKENNEKNK